MLDLLIEDATVLTMNPLRPVARRIGLWNGLIAGVDEELDGLRAARTVRLGGATVLPGFVDAHTHMVWSGMSQGDGLDLGGVRTREAVLDALRATASAARPGDWVEVTGYDQRAIGGHLTRRELDAVADGRKLWLQHTSGHACVVGTEVLDLLPAGELAALGADVDRGADGEPTGLLLERGQLAVRGARLPYRNGELVDAIERAGRTCLAQGITTCAEAGIGGGLIGTPPVEVAAYQSAREQNRLPVRMQLMVAADALREVAAHPEDRIARGLDLGLRTGFGDHTLDIGALKLWLDGGIMARTAALTAPYTGSTDAGQLQDDPEVLRRTILDGHDAGWQLAVHAIGDRALDLALDALEQARARTPRADPRHRIEHCGTVRPDQIARIAEVGAIAVIQPEFLWDNGDDYSDVLGPDRAGWLYRGRSLLDAGVEIASSSDRPVVAGAPLRAVRFMVERRSDSGRAVGATEAITVTEALRAATVGAARACRREDVCGSVERGKMADLTVLDADPSRTAVDGLADIGVVATMVGGELRHGAL
ncbi:amidohydrolase [Amycolatopsis antarctica]|uniref:Amidohydrolase n=1 Tax=Amycolatopsis antarctica TaxID=1854586 RepID=A0A263D1D3_9PSEU|nr:amidohydrolase [Amycolatopsis antarctica]OZM72294.1 amidohydrolase [Amycolatopsis antarctica]